MNTETKLQEFEELLRNTVNEASFQGARNVGVTTDIGQWDKVRSLMNKLIDLYKQEIGEK